MSDQNANPTIRPLFNILAPTRSLALYLRWQPVLDRPLFRRIIRALKEQPGLDDSKLAESFQLSKLAFFDALQHMYWAGIITPENVLVEGMATEYDVYRNRPAHRQIVEILQTHDATLLSLAEELALPTHCIRGELEQLRNQHFVGWQLIGATNILMCWWEPMSSSSYERWWKEQLAL